MADTNNSGDGQRDDATLFMPPAREAAPPPPPSTLTAFAPPVPGAQPAERSLIGPLRGLLGADGSAVAVLRLDGEILELNEPMLRLLGADTHEDVHAGSGSHALLRSLLDHVPHEVVNDPEGGVWRGDFDHTTPIGEERMYRATVRVEADLASDSGGILSLLAHDVTASRREAGELRTMATQDSLTGLPTRAQLLTELADALGEQRKSDGHAAVIFVDIDRLKYVNDALGHDVGDELLRSVAQRLEHAVRPADVVGRLGGDEFAVVSRDVPDEMAALDLGERVRRALSGRLKIDGFDLEFSVSIGIALSDEHVFALPDDPGAALLVSNADTAMYEAKTGGRGRSLLFTSAMRSRARERTEIAAALARSVRNQDLTVEYQPVFSAITQQAVGAEALVRWHHPTRGPMDPTTFISVAEESGTIVQLGEQVLRRALIDVRLWMKQQIVAPDFMIHVNVSRVQLALPSFVTTVMSLLREFRLPPAQLVLEARETALLGSAVDVERSVRALRRMGVQIAIDNFGTGPNALSLLTDIGADLLKLDGSLALPSGSSDADTRLVRALVLLAHALDMRVVAERVSGIEQLRRLRAAGCDYVQGHLLGQPQPPDLFTPTTPS
jgi:diguanylate cyclase (GGDEF)-like protein